MRRPDRRDSPCGGAPFHGGEASRIARFFPALALVGAFLLAGCRNAPEVEAEYFRTPTPHEAQGISIRERGLQSTALGGEWLAEAEHALRNPIPVDGHYLEAGRFVRSEADAVAYRIPVERGQRLEIRIRGRLMERGGLLVDLFRTSPEDPRRHAWIRSLPGGAGHLDLEPRRDGEYLLRLQPALFAQGGYELEIRTVSALRFPVLGHDNRAVWSEFGAPREGGRRRHHGVDIFAPRGTPVLATSAAEVRRVDRTPVGGNIVWLRDRRRGHSLYYAHLESQTVREGQWVTPGDTVGLVGNSGNARTTPTHLHFGLYARGRGPIDPLPFIRVLPKQNPEILADVERTGTWSRSRGGDIRLRAGPSTRSDAVADLGPERPFRVVAATGDWYRVRLGDGTEGYVAARITEDAAEPSPAQLAERASSPREGGPAAGTGARNGSSRTSDRVEDRR